jgi:hypothetical protein
MYTGTLIKDLMTVVESADIHAGVVSDLCYASYRANRLRSPGVLPERWALIFPSIDELEERFQTECHGADREIVRLRG